MTPRIDRRDAWAHGLSRACGVARSQCLALTDQRAIIKVGWHAGQTLGGKVTSFDYRNITSIEVRTSIMTGTFEIATGGVQGTERSYWQGSNKASSAWRAPNVIPIAKRQQASFQQVAAFIRAQSRPPAPESAQPTTPDVPDQIRKLADLRDQGSIHNRGIRGEKGRSVGANMMGQGA
ncbi:MAG TPA: hypothetical protein VMU49_09535 [Candidatus Acidoferrales bacterium]|nr:hypothetical protein [Candidatus Acidoferrales bacterium]